MRSAIISIALAFLSLQALAQSAQGLADPAAARAFAEDIMAAVSAERIALDSERLIPHWARLRPEFVREKVEALRSDQERWRHLFGRSVGYEFIGEAKVGTSLLRLSYVQRLERAPLLWRIYFYKAGNTWPLQGLLLDEDPSASFREFAK